MRLLRSAPVLLLVLLAGCGSNHGITRPALLAETTSPADVRPAPGAIYTMTNSPTGNAVLAFDRQADGSLSAPVAYPTGGIGTGAGLGNQGGMLRAGRWLFAANAGSDEISMFRVQPHGLVLVDRVGSGGVRPVSLTSHGDRLFVLNTGGSGNIAGFRIRPNGELVAIGGSTRPLSGSDVAAAQIGFTPDGAHLVVTERASNRLSVYGVSADGAASGPAARPSSGQTPFGFGFDSRGSLIVSEVFGGAAGASALSSYRFAGGALNLVSASVPTTQTAACWVAVSGRFAYATNAGSASITGFAIGPDGALMRLDAGGVTAGTGAGPSDVAVAAGRWLYVRNSGGNSIGAYAMNDDGSLRALTTIAGLPMGANGLAAD
jgi:6-phosphogluconolactonase